MCDRIQITRPEQLEAGTLLGERYCYKLEDSEGNTRGYHYTITQKAPLFRLRPYFDGHCEDTDPRPAKKGAWFGNSDPGIQPGHAMFLMDYSVSFDERTSPNLLLVGPQGTGKTWLAECVCNSLLGHIVSARDLSAAIRGREGWNDDRCAREEAQEEWAWCLRTRLLVIDDLGSERTTASDIFHEGMQDLLDKRKCPIVVTTNLSGDALEARYGSKIMSRLMRTARTLIFQGEDLRLRKDLGRIS